jgi:hypothetical protein
MYLKNVVYMCLSLQNHVTSAVDTELFHNGDTYEVWEHLEAFEKSTLKKNRQSNVF